MSTYVKMTNEKQHGLVGKWNMSSGVRQTRFQHSGGLAVFGIGNTGEIRHDMSFPRESVQTLRGSLAEDTGEKKWPMNGVGALRMEGMRATAQQRDRT